MTVRAAKLFSDFYGDATCAVVARAPGRVVLVGDHTSYNDGLVLTTLIDQYVEVIARKRPDRRVRMAAADLDERIETGLGEPIDFGGPKWTPFVFGIVHMLEQRGLLTTGVDLVFRGTVPMKAGLGSSAALELAVALALEGIFQLWLKPVEMAKLCHEVEHRFAGNSCSIADQLSCRLGQPGAALAIDCRTLDARHVPLPLENHRLVVIDTGVRADDGTDLGDRRRECREALENLRAVDPSIRALRDLTEPVLTAHREHLSTLHFSRCRHVVEEILRVAEASEVLPGGDLSRFGELMSISHRSVRDEFDASHPVIDRLVDLGDEVSGVLGSRITGGGFGGSSVHLATAAAAGELEAHLRPLLDDLPDSTVLLVGSPTKAGVVEVIA